MDLNLCLEILNQRNTTPCDCSNLEHIKSCQKSKFVCNADQIASTSVSPSNDDVSVEVVTENLTGNSSNLTDMSNPALLNFMISIQRARVIEYSSFQEALAYLIDNNKLDAYPSLVGEMTSRFTVLSSNAIKIKVIISLPFILLGTIV